ncbi:MAG: hypothetical protein WKF35_07595 [Ferruginibacter sp.]
MNEEISVIPAEKKYTWLFSVCTIVNDWDEYSLMKQSFIENGFSANCEYLVGDNSDKNNFNAYSAIRRFLQDAGGKYIIIVHQDVRCIDPCSKLEQSLSDLETRDPLWALCGNAGANGYKNFAINIDRDGKKNKPINLPAKVTSLDENLLIIKSSSQLTISADIDSFHFYGTDLCIIADFLGYNCYVIDFLVRHLSKGNLTDMVKYQPHFVNKYGRKLRERFIQTTCTKFYLNNSPAKNLLYNKPYIFYWVKAANRFANLFKK